MACKTPRTMSCALPCIMPCTTWRIHTQVRCCVNAVLYYLTKQCFEEVLLDFPKYRDEIMSIHRPPSMCSVHGVCTVNARCAHGVCTACAVWVHGYAWCVHGVYTHRVSAQQIVCVSTNSWTAGSGGVFDDWAEGATVRASCRCGHCNQHPSKSK